MSARCWRWRWNFRRLLIGSHPRSDRETTLIRSDDDKTELADYLALSRCAYFLRGGYAYRLVVTPPLDCESQARLTRGDARSEPMAISNFEGRIAYSSSTDHDNNNVFPCVQWHLRQIFGASTITYLPAMWRAVQILSSTERMSVLSLFKLHMKYATLPSVR